MPERKRYNRGGEQSCLIKHAKIARALASIHLSAAAFYILNRVFAPEYPAACEATLAAELQWSMGDTRKEIDAMRKRGWLLEQGHRDTHVAPLSLTLEGKKTLFLAIAHTEKPMPESIHYLEFDTQFDQYAPAFQKVIRRRREFKLTMGYDGKAWNKEALKFPKAMGRKKIRKATGKVRKIRTIPTHDEATRTLLSGGGDPQPVES